jgi:hypothetical protein
MVWNHDHETLESPQNTSKGCPHGNSIITCVCVCVCVCGTFGILIWHFKNKTNPLCKLKFEIFWQFCKFEKSSIEMGEKIAAKFQKKEL